MNLPYKVSTTLRIHKYLESVILLKHIFALPIVRMLASTFQLKLVISYLSLHM